MRTRLAVLFILIPGFGWTQDPINVKLAARWFQEAKWASDDDAGQLWKHTLYGPIILVDPKTRRAVANQPDKQGKLKPNNRVWTGVIPASIPIANTATDWAGVRWTMVMLDLPDTTANRTLLVIHECWHRIQDNIGLPSVHPNNSHLDAKDGRIWLRLEYRALSASLISWGAERKQAIADALLFRAYRRSLFPTAKPNEDRMEIHEGMAEYTGIRLMGLGDWSRRSYLAGRMKVNALKPSFAFSFAYETGPAYGLLLDVDGTEWRTHLTPESSLSSILQGVEGVSLPSDIAAEARTRALAYGGSQIISEEEARERKHTEDAARYRKLLIDGPRFTLPMPRKNYSFDPNDTFAMGDEGIVFPSTQVSDDWGTLVVTGGALVNSAYDKVSVPAPNSSHLLEGPGWKVKLNAGWRIVPGVRKGDYTVVHG